MRYPDAIWYPGPSEKQGYAGAAVNAGLGVICHSMVGTFAGAQSRLEDTSREADGSYTPNAAASWHFSVLQDGKVLQHYDSLAVAWHAGSRAWNQRLIGIEHEGGYRPVNEPLTDAQRAASVKLVRWLSTVHGFALVRSGDAKGLYEHNEVMQTSCPSGRIPWDAYVEEHMPTPEYDELKQDIGNTLGTLGAVGQKVDALANLMRIVIPKLADEDNDEVKALLAALSGGK